MLYKVTDSDGCTRGGTQWGPGITHSAKGSPSQDINSDGWIHAYEHPVLALIFKSLHADHTANPKRLWEAEGTIGKRCGHIKCGCRSLTTVREIPFPDVPLQELVEFAKRATNAAYRGTILASAMSERSIWAMQLAQHYLEQGEPAKVRLHVARAAETATLSTPQYELDLIALLGVPCQP